VKLLYDQNLSPVLVRRLKDLFPGSEHVFEIGMGEARDQAIAAYAKQNGFAVVTKDSDFLFHAHGRLQAKVIWLRLQNCSTAQVDDVLRRHAIRIQSFWDDTDATLLTIM
jgi:predicted nuclease of predicted toxin-antitoxin system